MRRLRTFIILGALWLSGCAASAGLEGIAQECRSEDADTIAAEYPDAATIAQHNQLERESVGLEQQAEQAVRSTGNPDAGEADIEQSAQDTIDAEGLYDYQKRQQIADQCWEMLANLAGTEQAQWAQLQEQNRKADAAIPAHSAAGDSSPLNRPGFPGGYLV